MGSVRVSIAIVAFCTAVSAVSSTVLASPQDYCIAYATQLADIKIGVSGTHFAETPGSRNQAAAGEPDSYGSTGDAAEKWQSAYTRTFSACMDRYEPQPLAAAGDLPQSSKVTLGSRQPKAKSSNAPPKSKRLRGTK